MKKANREIVKAALEFIPAYERDVWLRIGMAIKSEFPLDGFDLWNEWSRKATLVYDPKAAVAVWKSFKNIRIGIGHVFYFAKQNGWEGSGEAYVKPTLEEYAARKAKEEAAFALALAKQREAQQAAAKRAFGIYKNSPYAPADHPYLRRKGVKPHGLRLFMKCLCVPLRDIDGRLHSLELIGPDGDKNTLENGRVDGCFYLIGRREFINDPQKLCIAEGFATAAKINEITGLPVAVARVSGNLLPVAKAFRQKYPAAEIILCADDDWKLRENDGLEKAKLAALEVKALLAIPVFPKERRDNDTDFCDLAKYGPFLVSRAILDAKHPTKTPPLSAKPSFRPM